MLLVSSRQTAQTRGVFPSHAHGGELGGGEFTYEEGAVVAARPADGVDLPLARGIEARRSDRLPHPGRSEEHVLGHDILHDQTVMAAIGENRGGHAVDR